jgi:hypothetical protein
LRHAFRSEREILRLERRVRLEADDVATVAQIKERASACADRTALQAVLVKIDRTEMFAVTAVLPLQLYRRRGLAFEIDGAEEVTAILTLDGTLSRSEKCSLMFGTEYSHVRCSLQGQLTVQVVFGAKHDIYVPGCTEYR